MKYTATFENKNEMRLAIMALDYMAEMVMNDKCKLVFDFEHLASIADTLHEQMEEQASKHKFTEENPHGKVVEVRQEAYHDVTVYEDGYEERFYIGE